MFNKKDNMSMTERLFWLSKLNQSGSGGGGGGGDTPSGGVFIVPAEFDVAQGTITLTKTWNEVKAAYDADKVIEIRYPFEEENAEFSMPILTLFTGEDGYGIAAISGLGSLSVIELVIDDPDGYPVWSAGGNG